jgi:hypothetical protein
VLQEIFALLQRRPFEAFSVVTSDGHVYTVPTSDHAALNPAHTRLIIFTDADEQFSLAALHIVGVRSPASIPA